MVSAMLTAGLSAELENSSQQRQTGGKRVKSSLGEVHQLTQGLVQLEGLQREQSFRALTLPRVSLRSSYLWGHWGAGCTAVLLCTAPEHGAQAAPPPARTTAHRNSK